MRRKLSATSRTSSKDDDTRSVASSFYVAKSVMLETENEGIVFRVYEICSNALVESFLEFGTSTILIRTASGDSPGPMVGSVVAVPDDMEQFQLFFYSDFSFFHLFERGNPVVLCTPYETGRRFVERLLELFQTFAKLPLITFPSLFACVPCSLKCVNAVQEMQTSKQAVMRGEQLPVSAAKLQPSSISNSNPAALVHQISLLINQNANDESVLDLFSTLQYLVDHLEIPLHLGPHLQENASVVVTLFEIMWKSMRNTTTRDAASRCVISVLKKFEEKEVGFVVSRLFYQLQQLMVVVLNDVSSVPQSSSGIFESSLISLFGFLKTSEIVKHVQNVVSRQGVPSLLKLAEAMCLVVHRCTSPIVQQNMTPRPYSTTQSLRELFNFSRSSEADPANQEAAVDQETEFEFRMSNLNLLFLPGLSVCISAITSVLDEVINIHFTTNLPSVSNRFIECVTALTSGVGKVIETVASDPVPSAKLFLQHTFPCLATFFRRLPLWCEYGGLAFVDSSAFAHATGFLIILFLSRLENQNSFSTLQCEWLSKLSTSCAGGSFDGFAAQLHSFHEKFTRRYPTWVEMQSRPNLIYASVMQQLSDLQARIAQSAPSPSLLLSIWTSCSTHVELYKRMVADPQSFCHRLQITAAVFPRSMFVARILSSTSNRSVSATDSVIPLLDSEIFGWEWNNLVTYKQLNNVATGNTKTTNESWSVGFTYVAPWIHREKVSGRLHVLPDAFFRLAELLQNFDVSNEIVALVLNSALDLASRATGFSPDSCVSISRFFHSSWDQGLTLWDAFTSINRVHEPQRLVVKSEVQQAPQEIEDVVEIAELIPQRKRNNRNLLDKFV